jgi:hypothetical protein
MLALRFIGAALMIRNAEEILYKKLENLDIY